MSVKTLKSLLCNITKRNRLPICCLCSFVRLKNPFGERLLKRKYIYDQNSRTKVFPIDHVQNFFVWLISVIISSSRIELLLTWHELNVLHYIRAANGNEWYLKSLDKILKNCTDSVFKMHNYTSYFNIFMHFTACEQTKLLDTPYIIRKNNYSKINEVLTIKKVFVAYIMH